MKFHLFYSLARLLASQRGSAFSNPNRVTHGRGRTALAISLISAATAPAWGQLDLDVPEITKPVYTYPSGQYESRLTLEQRHAIETLKKRKKWGKPFQWSDIHGLNMIELEHCAKTNGEAAYLWGRLNDSKLGLFPDPEVAVRSYWLSAREGNADGLYNLAVCFLHGDGVIASASKAAECMRRGYERLSCAKCGAYYSWMLYYGKGTERDASRSYRLACEVASEDSSGIGLYVIGMAYRDKLVEGVGIRDAVEMFEKSSLLGLSSATTELGFYYLKGIGVEKDLARGIQLTSEAALDGYPRAIHNLGACCEIGEGVPKNFELAIQFYRQAAALGDVESKKALQKYSRLSSRGHRRTCDSCHGSGMKGHGGEAGWTKCYSCGGNGYR